MRFCVVGGIVRMFWPTSILHRHLGQRNGDHAGDEQMVNLECSAWHYDGRATFAACLMTGFHAFARLLQRDRRKRMTVQQALAHPWIKGHAQLPDKPLSSIMLTRLKQFTQMSKLKCAATACICAELPSTAC